MADRTSTVRVNVVTDASTAGAGIAKFGKVAGLAALGVGALAVGAAVGANKLYGYADAQDDANASIAQGLKTMKLFGKNTGEVTARVIEQAEAISKATAVDITSIKTTQAKLLTFKELAKSAGNVNGQFNRATKAAIDLAAKGFGTAESNAVQLGKALNDPVNGLSALNRAGITFTETEKKRIATLVESNQIGEAQTIVLAAIEKQVGGTAAATAGGFELMKNQVSLFAQELAAKALPYLDAFGTFMIETGGPALRDFGRAAAEIVGPALRAIGTYLIENGIPALKRMANTFQEDILPVLRRFGTFVVDQVIPALAEFSTWVQDHVVPVVEGFLVKALDRARGLFNDVAAAVKRNRPELEDMVDKLKKVATFIVDKVAPVVGDLATSGLPVLGAAITVAIETISGLWTAFNNIWDIVKKVVSAIGDLKSKLESLPGGGALAAVAGAASRGASGRASDLPGNQFPDKGKREVHIHLDGAAFIGDELQLAEKIGQVLDRNAVRFGLVS